MNSSILNPFKKNSSSKLYNNITTIQKSKKCTYDDLSDEDQLEFYYPKKKIDKDLLKDEDFNNNYIIVEKFKNKIDKGVFLVKNKISDEMFICKAKKKIKYNEEELKIIDKLLYVRSNRISNYYKFADINNIKYILLEYIHGETLTEYSKKLNSSNIKTIMEGCIKSLIFFHSLGFIHCDIKPDNFIVNEKDNNTVQIHLIDFDLSISKETVFESLFGTENFIPPECYDYGLFCKKSDVWSLGVVFFFLLTKQKITYSNMFIKNSGSNLFRYNSFKHLNYDLIKNSEFYDLILKMTRFNRENRLSSDECLKEFEKIIEHSDTKHNDLHR